MPHRTLFPREHGAYAALGFPMATAFGIGAFTLPAILIALGSAFAFLAHESALVVLGLRGKRAANEGGPRARAALGVLAMASAVTGGIGLCLAPRLALALTIFPSVLAAVVVIAVVADREKTLAGELSALLGLVTASLPVAIAANVPLDRAALAVAVWAASFVPSTLVVRATIAKPRPRAWVPLALRIAAVAAGATAAGFAIALAVVTSIPRPAHLALLPGAAIGCGFGLWRLHPRRLRRLGWAIVAADACAFALLVAGLR